jgi:hypothetical protein
MASLKFRLAGLPQYGFKERDVAFSEDCLPPAKGSVAGDTAGASASEPVAVAATAAPSGDVDVAGKTALGV